MVEGSTDHNEENEEPEEAVNLDISPAQLVDCYQRGGTPGYCAKRHDDQALPDVGRDNGVYLFRGRVFTIPDRGDDLWGIHSEAVEWQIDTEPAEGGCDQSSKVAIVPEVLFEVFPGWGWGRGNFFGGFELWDFEEVFFGILSSVWLVRKW
jgi:hypothetical protein